MIRLIHGMFLTVLFCGLIYAAEKESPADQPADATAVSNSDAGMDKTVQQLAVIVKKSVVVVTFRGRDDERQGLGSGFIIDSNGLIATNLHVIGEARPISVELHDGRRFDVTAVEATEKSHDLAVLRIDAKGLPALPLGDSDELQEGQPIMAIGNPIGLERSVVSGVLSGRRVIEGRPMLQVAVPIERGNSGGPMLDLQGRVHGLLTLKSLKTDNLGFAIPVNALKPLLQRPNPVPMNRWLTIGVMDPEDWTALPGGRWRQRAGRILVDGRGSGMGSRSICLSTMTAPEVPYELAVQVKFEPADGAAGLVFHADGGDKHYGFYPSNGSVRLSRFDGPDVYSWSVLREVRSPHLHKTGWNALKVRVESGRLLCYLNDQLVIDEKDSVFTSGRIGLCKFRQTEAEFKGFHVAKSIASSPPEDNERFLKMANDALAATADNEKVDPLLHKTPNGSTLLEQQALHLEQQAARLRRLAVSLQVQRTLDEFDKAILEKDAPLDLLQAALLISRLDNPELDVTGYVKEVERHARRAQATLPKDADETARFEALNRYLFQEQGFHGSRTDYDNRSNSYLNEVLDDREGLPITLSVVYMEIARRMGLNVVGVGMPRHFMVRHEPKEGTTQLVDVFERGQLLTPEDARKKFDSMKDPDQSWSDSYLAVTSSRAILDRVLENLLATAAGTEDAERMLRYVEASLRINPESDRKRFYRAVLSYQTQRWQQARSDVEWLRTHETNLNDRTLDDLSRAIERDSPK